MLKTIEIEEVRRAVEAAGRQHYAAAIAGDAAAIDELFCDEAIYSHSEGRAEDKSSYMDRVATGRYRGLEIDHSVEHIWLLGDDVAVVRGRQISSGGVGNVEMENTEAASLDVWCHRDGRWQLLAHHMTLRLGPDAWHRAFLAAQAEGA